MIAYKVSGRAGFETKCSYQFWFWTSSPKKTILAKKIRASKTLCR